MSLKKKSSSAIQFKTKNEDKMFLWNLQLSIKKKERIYCILLKHSKQGTV